GWADLVALALTPNLHASGITVVEEATVYGLPVVCTGTGGLFASFSQGEGRYVMAGRAAEVRAALAALAGDGAACGPLGDKAQRRMRDAGLTSRDFARRHAELSHELVRGHGASPARRSDARREWAARLALFVLVLVGAAAMAAHVHAAGGEIDPCRL